MGHRKPLIGITLDSEPAGGYANSPWYALRQNYADTLQRCGAVVVALPYQTDSVSDLATLCDGLLITGGGFDIDPALYGAAERHPSVKLKPERTQFEWDLLEQMLAANKPVLGICGGHQLLGVYFGAQLHQHLPDDLPANAPNSHATRLNHSPTGSLHNPSGKQVAHRVTITPGTALASVVQCADIPVNSSHHQAICQLDATRGLVVNATASDGVIEGIEHPDYQFCMGIQWHPEFELSQADTDILQAFVQACR